VKATLQPLPDGRLRVQELKHRSGWSEKTRIEGPVEEVRPIVTTDVRFRLLGVEVVAAEETDWEGGLPPPTLVVDDDDARPADRISLGRAGWLSGEVRLDLKSEKNYDLTHRLRDDLTRLRLRADFEWTLPSTRHVAAAAELRTQAEWVLHDEEGDSESDDQVSLGETWVLFRDLAGGRLSVHAGRTRWDDRRDWWYDARLDSVRVYLDLKRLRLELGVAEQLVEPTRRLEDARHHHLRLDLRLAKRHRLALIVLDRDDLGDGPGFAPTWFGLHAEGRVRRRLEYWTELAFARGSIGGVDVSAHAWDVGATVFLPGRARPAITVGRAYGSGDADPCDGTSRTFRQTGLHANSGRWGGATSFRYYGEVLRPELANLSIDTIGFGVRPRDWLSVDLAWHRYEQDEPSAALVGADAGSRRRLNLVDTDVGEEWDLVFAEHWELELDVGVFRPGAAFLGDRDDAWGTFLKLKYVF
jgi:hypothetical protein